MKIFKSNYFTDLINQVTRAASVCPLTSSREGKVHSLGQVCLELTNISNAGIKVPSGLESTYSHDLLEREKALYFLPEKDVKYMPKYKKYCRTGQANCNAMYGQFIAPQIPKVIKKLKNYPDTRQAVIYIGNNELIETNDIIDVPCTCLIQFKVIPKPYLNELDCTVVMRSNDIRLGLLYDVPAAVNLQQVIINSLGIGWGRYHHIVLDMHLYDKDVDYMLKWATKIQAKEMINYNTYFTEVDKAKRWIYGE